MKYEYLMGSENDFEGAPSWATECVWNDKQMESFCYWLNPETKTIFNPNYHQKPDFWNEEYGHRNYVKARRRPIIEPEWGGVGLPPIGCECEAMISNPATVGHGWRKVKVVHVGAPGSKSEALVFDVETTYPAWADEFRLLRTEEDKRLDEVVMEINRCAGASMAIGAEIYNAIAAGKIPGVKLED